MLQLSAVLLLDSLFILYIVDDIFYTNRLKHNFNTSKWKSKLFHICKCEFCISMSLIRFSFFGLFLDFSSDYSNLL